MIKTFKNFLSESIAETLHNGIMTTPEQWWSYAVMYTGLQKVRYFKNTFAERQALESVQSNINNSFTTGNFTYKFKRSTSHVKGCNCYECNFKETFLNSEDFKNFISVETGLENPEIYESFCSVYEKGDYLSMHPDAKRGVAFILNLTKAWRPEFGGLLHIKQDDDTYKVIFPEYNSLVLLQLGEAGTPHFVSEVSAYAPIPRIAISGWYNEGA